MGIEHKDECVADCQEIATLNWQLQALKAENERLSKVLEEEDRLHKSIIEIACVGSKEKKYQSVPERGVAMLYKEKEELKAENERLKEEAEQLRVKLAGCGVAAFGGKPECNKGDYGWSPSYEDVKTLWKKYIRKPNPVSVKGQENA
jgi:uncharacterized protein YdcH (DUF465 family)